MRFEKEYPEINFKNRIFLRVQGALLKFNIYFVSELYLSYYPQCHPFIFLMPMLMKFDIFIRKNISFVCVK